MAFTLIRRLIWRFRSAITGRYVTRAEAEAHPSTTVRERYVDSDPDARTDVQERRP